MIDVWERYNFNDDIAFQISKKLSKSMTLLEIAQDMEKRLFLNQGDSSTTKLVSQDTTISSLFVVIQMAKSGEKLLNDLIIFLTMCPQGLCLTELQILLKRFPTSLPDKARDEKIKTYTDLFKSFATAKGGSLLQPSRPQSDVISTETSESTESLEEII